MANRDTRRWRGLKALVHDGVDATTELVDVGHESTMRTVTAVTDQVEPLREPVRLLDGVRRFSTRGLLTTVRVVNRVVERVTDAALDAAAVESAAPVEGGPARAMPMRSDATATGAWLGDAAVGLVNAVVGDHLSAQGNGLDMGMAFRLRDRYVPLDTDSLAAAAPERSPRVALFVHGLATTEWSWCLESEAYHGEPGITLGSLLERDLAFTPVYLRYNTGRHVSENGRLLAAEIERFVSAYPVPIEDLTLVGHSMGGLVVRSACHYGAANGNGWTSRVRRVVCLGAPHRGAPLAKLGNVVTGVLDSIDLPAAQIGARLLATRSAGIKDLSHGAVIDEHWLETDLAAMDDTTLLPAARHYFMSATITDDPDHPVGRLVGDMLVREPSAQGPAMREAHFAIETSRYGGVMHHQLQNHPALYEQLRRACAET